MACRETRQLRMRIYGVFKVGDPFYEQEEGVVVDEEDDAEGEEGVFESEEGEAGGGEGLAGGVEMGEEGGCAGGEVVDVDGPCFGGGAEAEMEAVRGRGEGGDVVVFLDDFLPLAGGCRRRVDGVEFHFAEGVGDFGDGEQGCAGFTMYVVKRDGVEGVAEDAREGDEGDLGVGWDGDLVFGEPVGEVLADIFLRVCVDVVLVVKGEEVEAVVGEEGFGGDGVEVDGDHEDAVGEGVFFGGDAGVGDGGFVYGVGWHQEGA